MSLWELFVIAVGLSMDAFAVAICKGLSVGRVRGSHAVTAGIYFGGFQMLMPLLGYLLGVRFQEIIAGVDHWIAFLLLGLIGANMIRESRGGEEHVDSSFRPRSMLSAAGVYIGGAFGDRFQGKAEFAGGVILVLMGSKILLEHLGFLG